MSVRLPVPVLPLFGEDIDFKEQTHGFPLVHKMASVLQGQGHPCVLSLLQKGQLSLVLSPSATGANRLLIW